MIAFGVPNLTSSLAIHARAVASDLDSEFRCRIELWTTLTAGSSSADVWIALWWKTFRFARPDATKILCVYDHESWRQDPDRFEEKVLQSDALVFGSLGLLEDVRRWWTSGPSRERLPPCFVVPPGVDLGDFHQATLPDDFRAMWSGNSWALSDDGKGIEIARKACAKAGVALSLADRTGDDGSRLEHSDMPAFYAQNSVLLVPSRCEGAPRAAIEAMACGRPVIGTRVGLIPELVSHGLTGCIVERTPDAFAAALLYMRDLLQQHPVIIPDLCRVSASRYSIHRCAKAWSLAIRGAQLSHDMCHGPHHG